MADGGAFTGYINVICSESSFLALESFSFCQHFKL